MPATDAIDTTPASRTSAPREKIMLVDDNIANLTAGRHLLKPFFEVYPATSAEQMFAMLEKVRPALILLDVDMPATNGYEAIGVLKRDRRFADIPVIFVTALGDETSELRGFDLGAVDYVSKPFSPPLLVRRIESQLLILRQREEIRAHAGNLEDAVRRRTGEVLVLQNAMLDTVADLVEFRGGTAGGHAARTQLYLRSLAEEMRADDIYRAETNAWDMDFLVPSSQLHDVGKIAVPDVVLNKPGDLTPEEWEVMKTHVPAGLDVARGIMAKIRDHGFMRHVLNLIGSHHEKWNGSGYPAGLRGEDIPLEGRAMAIVDAYDAIVSWRPYRAARGHAEAVREIRRNAGTHFDPLLTEVFLRVEGEFEGILRAKV